MKDEEKTKDESAPQDAPRPGAGAAEGENEQQPAAPSRDGVIIHGREDEGDEPKP